MWKKLMPDRYYDSVSQLTAADLEQYGIRALICDIDNTLVTYDDPEPTPSAMEFLSRMQAAGVQIAFVSNNDRERVNRFNASLGWFASAKSAKPSARELRRAMEYMGTTVYDTAVLGDQLFTDIYAGKRLGMRAFLVKPIRDKRSLFFRFKRKCEIPVLRAYAKAHGEPYRPNV